MTCETTERGAPYVEVPAKRVFDRVPVLFDWHDYLAVFRESGKAYTIGTCVRLPRSPEATGLQYRCTVAGVTSGAPASRVRWPTVAGQSVTDGTVTWTAEAADAQSLRTTISGSVFVVPSALTAGTPTVSDLAYVVQIAGGVDGTSYEVKHQITMANGELKEGVAVLPVID